MEITILVISGILVGIVEIIKTFVKDKRFYPVIALALGIFITILAGDVVGVVGLKNQIITGLVLGLTSVGLYSGGKTLGE